MQVIGFIRSIPDFAAPAQLQERVTGDSKDESMGAISRTCEESVPLYISVSEGRNVKLDSPTASGMSRKIA